MPTRFGILLLLALPMMGDQLTVTGTMSNVFSVNGYSEVGTEYRINPDGSITFGVGSDDLSGAWALWNNISVRLPSQSVINSDSVTFSNFRGIVSGDGVATTTLRGESSSLGAPDQLEFFQENDFELEMDGTADLRYQAGPFVTGPPGNYIQTAELYNFIDYTISVDYTVMPEPAGFWLTGLGIAGFAASLVRKRYLAARSQA